MTKQSSTDQALAKRSLKSLRKLSERYKNNAESIELAVKEDGTVFNFRYRH